MLSQLATQNIDCRTGIERDGIVCLTKAISAEWLAAARADVTRYLDIRGPGDRDLVDLGQWQCPHIEAFATDPQVASFLDSLIPSGLTRAHTGYNTRVLRILDGTGGVNSRPHLWHYDGSAVTMVIPIVVPADGTGQLAVFPHSRPHRSSAALSAFEQAITHNRVYSQWIRRHYKSEPSAYAVPFAPGDVYLFRGYRSLHGSLPWPDGDLRVTLVLQYGHPYGPESGLLQTARGARDRWRRLRGHTQPGGYSGN